MKLLLPPSRADLARNVRLLVDDFRNGSVALRYYIVSQALSGLLLGLCSAAAVAAGVAGVPSLYLGLMGAASLCLVHSVATWHVLKQRYQVRYEVW